MDAPGYRFRSIISIGCRGFKSLIYSPGFYGTIFLSALIAVLISYIYLKVIFETGVLVMANPLNIPLIVTMMISASYLAFTASLSISKERDSGTVEVLFYGAVDSISYVLAKYLEQMLSFVAMLVFYLIIFWLLGTRTNFGLSMATTLILVLAGAVASNVVALGIFLSIITSKIRTSILTLIAFLVLFIVVQLGNAFLAGLEFNGSSFPWAGSIISVGVRIVGWVSPFAYLNRGVKAIGIKDLSGYFTNFGIVVFYSILLLMVAIIIFQKKGAGSR